MSFVLKYSPSTALTASGIDSSFRALRSCSRAFTISSDMATIILFIAKVDSLPLYSDSNPYSFWLCIAMCSDWYMATVIVTREERGRMIAEQANQVQRLDERTTRSILRAVKLAMMLYVAISSLCVGFALAPTGSFAKSNASTFGRLSSPKR